LTTLRDLKRLLFGHSSPTIIQWPDNSYAWPRRRERHPDAYLSMLHLKHMRSFSATDGYRWPQMLARIRGVWLLRGGAVTHAARAPAGAERPAIVFALVNKFTTPIHSWT
jgi:hypothetical protein